MAKELSFQSWIEELLPLDVVRKPMFGGYAYYLDGRLVLTVFEGDEPWNGCMVPAEKEHHAEIRRLIPNAIDHPILGKWLYLAQDSEEFEDSVTKAIREISNRSPLFGTVPKEKKKSAKASPRRLRKASRTVVDEDDDIDTTRPRMFSDEPAEEKLKKVKRISDFKNLGPVSERAFAKAGIKTADQFVKLGWQKTMAKLGKVDPKNLHTVWAYALIGALKNQEWNRLSDADKRAAKEFVRSLKKK